MELRIPPYIDRYFFAALANFISFILTLVCLFDNDWIYAHYANLKINMGVCCTFTSFPFMNVALVFMYLLVNLSVGSSFMSITTWIFQAKGAPEGNVSRWARVCILLNLIIGVLTTFLLIYFGLSFSNNLMRKLVKGVFNLSTCYWLLIPVSLLNLISISLIVSKIAIIRR